MAVTVVVTVLGAAGRPASSLALSTDAESVGATLTADVLGPPGNVTCNGGGTSCMAGLGTRPVISWTAPADPYATGFRVYRSTTSGSGYVEKAVIGSLATTSWTDTTSGLSIASTYYYVVRTDAGAWSSVFSSQVAVTIVLGL